MPANRLREPLAAAFARVPAGWRGVTDAFLAGDAGQRLVRFVDGRVAEGAVVYPATVFLSSKSSSMGCKCELLKKLHFDWEIRFVCVKRKADRCALYAAERKG